MGSATVQTALNHFFSPEVSNAAVRWTTTTNMGLGIIDQGTNYHPHF